MKATRRHELQQNVLDAELGKTVEFFRKYGARIFWAVIVVAAISLAVSLYVSRVSEAKAAIEARAAGLLGPVHHHDEGSKQGEHIAKLKSLIALENVPPRIAAAARVRLGDLYALRMVKAKAQAERSTEGKQAGDYYRMVLSDFSGQKLAVAQAHLGLAKLAESRKDFDAAAKEYDAAMKMTKDLGDHPVPKLAEAGKAALKGLREPVRMAATAPASRPAATGAPEAKPAAADTPAPALAR